MTQKNLAKKLAKESGKTRYFTGIPCKHGHIAERMVNNRACVDCQKKAKLKNYAKSDVTKSSQAMRSRRWYLENKDKADAASKKWAEKHPEAVNARFAKRRATVRNRIPKWANIEKIKEFYKTAKDMESSTGIKYHVDHIIPLQGENVSGLHVETNLQIIDSFSNWSKGNRLLAA